MNVYEWNGLYSKWKLLCRCPNEEYATQIWSALVTAYRTKRFATANHAPTEPPPEPMEY